MKENTIVNYEGALIKIKRLGNAINLTSKLLSNTDSLSVKIKAVKALNELFSKENFPKVTQGFNEYTSLDWCEKVILIYVNMGVYKFSDIVKDIYARIGINFKIIFVGLKLAYSVTYLRTTDEQAEKMDYNTRKVTYESIARNQ